MLDVADSVWLARICQFGLCSPSLVPPAQFRALRKASRLRLLASLSHHVRRHLESLCDALSARLDAQGYFLLHDQMRAFHDATARVDHYDRCLEGGLAEFRDRIHLLMTIPGIDHASAFAILVELGPDIGVFASPATVPPGPACVRATTRASANAASAAPAGVT